MADDTPDTTALGAPESAQKQQCFDLRFPWIGGHVEIAMPADKWTTMVLVAVVCTSLVLIAWLIVVQGNTDNVARIFGFKASASTTSALSFPMSATMPLTPPCLCGEGQSLDEVFPEEEPTSQPEESATKIKQAPVAGETPTPAKVPTTRPQADNHQLVEEVWLQQD
jgi:hypothetical protein